MSLTIVRLLLIRHYPWLIFVPKLCRTSHKPFWATVSVRLMLNTYIITIFPPLPKTLSFPIISFRVTSINEMAGLVCSTWFARRTRGLKNKATNKESWQTKRNGNVWENKREDSDEISWKRGRERMWLRVILSKKNCHQIHSFPSFHALTLFLNDWDETNMFVLRRKRLSHASTRDGLVIRQWIKARTHSVCVTHTHIRLSVTISNFFSFHSSVIFSDSSRFKFLPSNFKSCSLMKFNN